MVIAANPSREVFVLEDQDGHCGVFWIFAGPPVAVGEIMTGEVGGHYRYHFLHRGGVCWARGVSAVLTRAQAMEVLAANDRRAGAA